MKANNQPLQIERTRVTKAKTVIKKQRAEIKEINRKLNISNKTVCEQINAIIDRNNEIEKQRTEIEKLKWGDNFDGIMLDKIKNEIKWLNRVNMFLLVALLIKAVIIVLLLIK